MPRLIDLSNDCRYPYQRAEAFMKSIKRMGMAHGIDFLGAFRQLVTEIGNALGYVRMIRSGGLRYCSNATVRKNDEFCIKHEELCIKNEEFCVSNDEFCVSNDEFCRRSSQT